MFIFMEKEIQQLFYSFVYALSFFAASFDAAFEMSGTR